MAYYALGLVGLTTSSLLWLRLLGRGVQIEDVVLVLCSVGMAMGSAVHHDLANGNVTWWELTFLWIGVAYWVLRDQVRQFGIFVAIAATFKLSLAVMLLLPLWRRFDRETLKALFPGFLLFFGPHLIAAVLAPSLYGDFFTMFKAIDTLDPDGNYSLLGILRERFGLLRSLPLHGYSRVCRFIREDTRLWLAIPGLGLLGAPRAPSLALQSRSEQARSMAALSLAEQCGPNRSIGVAVPGFADGEVICSSPNIPQWPDVPFGRLLAERAGCPVHLENDGSAAAWGASLQRGSGEDLVLLTLGTGVGGGVVSCFGERAAVLRRSAICTSAATASAAGGPVAV